MLTFSIVTGARPPCFARGREVNVWHDEAGRAFARGYSGDRRHWIDWPDIGLFGFEAGSLEVSVWLTRTDRASAAADAGRRVLQPMILQALGFQALHASAIVLPEGVMAFCGRSGHGKSTLAYALAARGFRQFADDAVLLEIVEDRAIAHPLRFTPRLRPPSEHHLGPTVAGHGERAPAPLHVLWILELLTTGDRPQVERISEVHAFSALVAHAHCFDPTDADGTKRMAEAYMAVAASVPVMRLRYPPGFDRLDAVLDSVLAAVPGSAGRRPAAPPPTTRSLA